MKTARDRTLNVLAAADATRDQYPEIAERLTPRRLWRLLEAEKIRVLQARIRRPARARGFDGAFVISIRHSLAPRLAWQWALHEYAHIKLGHFAEGDEIERQLSPCRRGDPREIEARLFSLLLVLGATATPDHPDVAKLIAKLEAVKHKRRMPEQLPLEIPLNATGDYKPLPEPFQHEREYERGVRRRGGKSLRPKSEWIFRDVPTHDDERRIKWLDETKGTTRFEDVAGRRWWIYNFRKTAKGWEPIRDFMQPEITHRLFVNSAGARRLYQFADAREHRAYRVKHLDRQVAQAVQLTRRGQQMARGVAGPTRSQHSKNKGEGSDA